LPKHCLLQVASHLDSERNNQQKKKQRLYFIVEIRGKIHYQKKRENRVNKFAAYSYFLRERAVE
jgi:hypothetical protein